MSDGKMKEKMNCPLCNKRVFDISSSIKGKVSIELKCPHCRHIIQVHYTYKPLQIQKDTKEKIVSFDKRYRAKDPETKQSEIPNSRSNDI